MSSSLRFGSVRPQGKKGGEEKEQFITRGRIKGHLSTPAAPFPSQPPPLHQHKISPTPSLFLSQRHFAATVYLSLSAPPTASAPSSCHTASHACMPARTPIRPLRPQRGRESNGQIRACHKAVVDLSEGTRQVASLLPSPHARRIYTHGERRLGTPKRRREGSPSSVDLITPPTRPSPPPNPPSTTQFRGTSSSIITPGAARS